MPYRDQMDLARDPIFIQRVKMAMINTATTVFNESGGTAFHIQRAAYARQVLNSPDSFAPAFSFLVAADAINFPATITRDAGGNILTSNGASAGVDAGIDGRCLNCWNSLCVS